MNSEFLRKFRKAYNKLLDGRVGKALPLFEELLFEAKTHDEFYMFFCLPLSEKTAKYLYEQMNITEDEKARLNGILEILRQLNRFEVSLIE